MDHTAIPMSSHQAVAQKYDENGDEIKIEGICKRSGVACDTTWTVIAILGVSLLVGVVFVPFFIIGGFMFVKNWRLYVTRRGIYYTRPNRFFGCCLNQWFFPLEDIEDVFTAQGAHFVWIKMTPDKLYGYSKWYYNPPLVQQDCLVLGHVENSDDFVAAIKREKEGN